MADGDGAERGALLALATGVVIRPIVFPRKQDGFAAGGGIERHGSEPPASGTLKNLEVEAMSRSATRLQDSTNRVAAVPKAVAQTNPVCFWAGRRTGRLMINLCGSAGGAKEPHERRQDLG